MNKSDREKLRRQFAEMSWVDLLNVARDLIHMLNYKAKRMEDRLEFERIMDSFQTEKEL